MNQYKHQYECLDEHCKTITLDFRNRDGLRCPKCNGPVVPMPFKPIQKISKRAQFVGKEIIWNNHEHCFDLTPEQVETVLKLGDEYAGKNNKMNTICTVNVGAAEKVDAAEVAKLVKESIIKKLNNLHDRI